MVLDSGLHAGQRVRVTVADGTLRFGVAGTEPNPVAQAPATADV